MIEIVTFPFGKCKEEERTTRSGKEEMSRMQRLIVILCSCDVGACAFEIRHLLGTNKEHMCLVKWQISIIYIWGIYYLTRQCAFYTQLTQAEIMDNCQKIVQEVLSWDEIPPKSKVLWFSI